MKTKIFVPFMLAVLFISGCEKTVIAYPGNTQELNAEAPVGSISWSDALLNDGDKSGKLPENSAFGLTIGLLDATDENPDDEASFELVSQTIDGADVNYFDVMDSVRLVLINSNINFEAISGSKEVKVQINVTDDSPEKVVGTLALTIEITDVNESPNFQNIASIIRFADEYIDYTSMILWDDVDDGPEPILTTSGKPDWLSISNSGVMSGQPGSDDIGSHPIVLVITDDGGITVQEEITIEVRGNSPPMFSNLSSLPSTVVVGCWEENQNLIDLTWYDSDNSASGFAGNGIYDEVIFSVVEEVSWMNWSDDGKLFCVTSPDNDDAATSNVTMTITDNRPVAPKSNEYLYELIVVANDAPSFTNISSFPSEMAAGDTLNFDLDWVDPNEDQTTFNMSVTIGSNAYSPDQLGWITIDQSGNILMIPGNNNNGEKILSFFVSDGCYTSEEQRNFTIE